MGYAETCKADGAVALYLMDEASGQFRDSIGTQHLTPVGTFTRRQNALPGGGILPDGSTGYAVSATSVLTVSDNITMECWINLLSTTTSYGCLVSNAPDASSNGVSFGLGNGGSGLGSAFQGNQITVLYDGVRWNPTSFTVSLGIHHLAITRTTTNLTAVYIDGVLQGNSPDPGAPPAAPSGATTKVGGYITGGGTSSRVANVPVGGAGFYSTVLSAAQLLNHYKVGLRNGVSY